MGSGVSIIEATIAQAQDGMRLDRALADLLPDLSRERLKALINDGHVRSTGQPIKIGTTIKVATGQSFAITLPAPVALDNVAQDIPLNIVHEDADLIVVGALDLLAEMRAKRTHLAIVLDEYSGTEGLLTFEDLVEEIVGDVEDEHDDAPEAMLVPLPGGLWEADARAELDDVAEEIDEKLGDIDEDVDTLGGLAFIIAGRVPEPGEILDHEQSGWKLEILASDGRRVSRLRLHPPVEALMDDED